LKFNNLFDVSLNIPEVVTFNSREDIDRYRGTGKGHPDLQ